MKRIEHLACYEVKHDPSMPLLTHCVAPVQGKKGEFVVLSRHPLEAYIADRTRLLFLYRREDGKSDEAVRRYHYRFPAEVIIENAEFLEEQ